MADSGRLALIHAEIDGELDAEQRGELARCLLADPEARALREDFQRLCTALEAVEDVEPPPQLRESVLAALPQSSPSQARSWWSAPRLRYAALIAGVLAAGTVVYETLDGPRPATSDVAGTMAAAGAPTTLDTVRLSNGAVLGRVSLYRDRAGLSLGFELVAAAPVDVLVASDGHTLRVNGLGMRDGPGGPRTAVALPGFGRSGEAVDVTFLMAGHEVGRATLQAPKDH
jgi:anti-sigma factor RsiW